MTKDVTLAGMSRVWLFEEGVGPDKDPTFLGHAKIGDPAYNFGDLERIEVPDPNRYNGFVEAAKVQGAKERPTTSIMERYPRTLSPLLRAGRKGCRIDVHLHMGKCENPQDFDGGWEKKIVFRDAQFSSWGGENFGALASDEQNPTNETGELSASDLYEVTGLEFGELCAGTVARELVKVVVCDSQACGDCDDPSDGCEKVFAIQVGTGSTPGTKPSVVYSKDGGASCSSTDIDTLFSNETPTDAACVGSFLFVIATAGGVHRAPTADILAGTETWVEVTGGLVAGNGPIAMYSVDSQHTWVVGENGYIYFLGSPTGTFEVQDAGIATTQDLVDVHAFDPENAVAVGDLNAVVKTSNGGDTWQAVTGPAVGVSLNCVWMYSPNTWLVGSSLGILWLTTDGGQTWTNASSRLPITPLEIDEIEMRDDTVGYMAVHDGAAHSVILRTVSGGSSWYALPEGVGTIPDNDGIASLAVCADENVLYAAGVGPNASDGILLKASG